MAKCFKCAANVPEGKLRCPSCKTFQVQETPNEHVLSTRHGTLLKDVVSNDVDRLVTGPWDMIFGQSYKTGKAGITRSSVTLVGGLPGAGKSTWFLQIADEIPEQTGLEALYLTTEEPEDQIKARADRLQVKHQDRIRIVQCMSGEANIEEVIQAHKPGMLFLDSVTGLAGEDNMEMQVKICMIIKGFAAQHKMPALVSSHVNKGGEIAGLEKLQHAVDEVISFFPEGEGETAPRVLHVEKNRNGRAFISYPLLMTERGLEPYPTEEELDEEDEDEDDA
jgi:DNA repair protein RadA/Sms